MLKLPGIVTHLPILIMGKFRTWILKHRIIFLIIAGYLGLKLADNACDIVANIVTLCKPGNLVLESSVTILALSLPILFILWLFRTHDTQENINNSTFFECARLLATKDSPEEPYEKLIEKPHEKRIKISLTKKIALEQLAYLKRETSFDKKKIDLLTRNLSLIVRELSYAQLSGIDLSGTNLEKATLIKADLRNAKLINADLRTANLSGADLRGAKLMGADLRDTKLINANLSGADLEGAHYNDETDFEDTDYANKKVRDKAWLRWTSWPTQDSLSIIKEDKAEISRLGIKSG